MKLLKKTLLVCLTTLCLISILPTQSYAKTCTAHSWTDWSYAGQLNWKPTCTGKGHQSRKCKKCNKTVYRYTNPLGHNYKYSKSNYKPTCSSQGEDIYKCTRCSVSKFVKTKSLGHNWKKKTPKNKIKSNLYIINITGTGYQCSRCNFVKNLNISTAYIDVLNSTTVISAFFAPGELAAMATKEAGKKITKDTILGVISSPCKCSKPSYKLTLNKRKNVTLNLKLGSSTVSKTKQIAPCAFFCKKCKHIGIRIYLK